MNHSVDYQTRENGNNNNLAAGSLERNSNNSDYDPFERSPKQYRSTRQQRLKQDQAPSKSRELPKLQTSQTPNIYFPGELKVNVETREQKHDFMPNNNGSNRNLNRSQNIIVDYQSHINDSPKFRENRIKEALQDHSREGVEQSRYFSRLEKSNRKQKAVFAEHYKKYIVPNAIMINNKKEQEHQRMLDAKRRMEQLEIEQDNNQYTFKKQYNDYLLNQMAEKQRLKQQAREAKQRLYEHVEYKRKMYEDEVLHNKIEK